MKFESISASPSRRARRGRSASARWDAHALEPRMLLSASLVKDINAVTATSAPRDLTQVGMALYFAANDGQNYELWKTDGTAAGTMLVRKFDPVSTNSGIADLTAVNGTLFFVTFDAKSAATLWESDGTAAGTMAIDAPMINPGGFTAFNGKLLFDNGGPAGRQLWESDGTASGTMRVTDVNPGLTEGLGTAGPYVNVNGTLFFPGYEPSLGTELWKTDGTAAGTVMVDDIAPGNFSSNPTQLTNVNGTLFFLANDGMHGTQVWKTDGTAAGTVALTAPVPWWVKVPDGLTNVNGTLYFEGWDPASGQRLYKTDGTPGGAVPVGSGFSDPTDLTNVNGTLFFNAFDTTHGKELWKSDGSDAGTVLVKDINPGTGDSNPTSLTDYNGTLLFAANDGARGNQLWKSDGTLQGTVQVARIAPAPLSASIGSGINFDGAMFFVANDGLHGAELWRTDGTNDGTWLVKDINTETGDSKITSHLTIGATTYFAADDGIHGKELWKTDGTSGGTMMVADINPGTAASNPANLTDFNGALYFTANDGTHGYELWKSDGTAAGTQMVKDINPIETSSIPGELTVFDGKLFFRATDGVNGSELWATDGTAAGTRLVADIFPGAMSSTPTDFTVVGNTLFFEAQDGVHGVQIWKTDGTTSGTVRVDAIGVGSPPIPTPTDLTNVNGTLLFEEYGALGETVWSSDGTAAGTVELTPYVTDGSLNNLTVVNGLAYFTFNDQVHGTELWRTDGTVAGTGMVADLNPASAGSNPTDLTSFNGELYFSATDGVHGYQLWKTDGTQAGTVMLDALNPGGVGSLTVVGDKLFFTATDNSKPGLWVTDGTQSGTSLVTNAFPSVRGGIYTDMTAVDNLLYFVASDGTHGPQLWKSNGTPAGTALADPGETAGGWAPSLILGTANNELLFTASDVQHGNELWSLALPNATFVRSDATTGGTWTGHYGSDGFDLLGGPSSLPAYSQLSVAGASEWTWDASTSDARAPQTAPGANTRLAACDYSGTSFTVDLNLTDGNPHQVALYLLDYDYLGRAETAQVADGDSGRVLDTRTVGQFQGGEYLVYTLSGHVKITFTNAGGRNAVLSAILFDPASAAPSAGAAFIGTDATHQGQWTGAYGSQGYDVFGAGSSLPAYASLTTSGAQFWQWDNATNLPQELQTSPGSASRIAACDYSDSPSFSLDLNLTDGQSHRVALYVLDYDGRNRAETITIRDAGTGAVLDSELVSNFTGGKYLIWNLSGHVTITIANSGGLNEVVSGIFIDPAKPTTSATAAFVTTDANAQGNWTGVYGADGYTIANAGSSLPAYATLGLPAGLQNYTWAGGTTEPRALQTGPGATTRIAACDYSDGPSFTLDLNLADGNVHRVALYLLDYDLRNRAETVQISDATTGAVLDTQSVSNFTQGKYLVWNLSGHVKITISNAGGLNEVLSGIFFG